MAGRVQGESSVKFLVSASTGVMNSVLPKLTALLSKKYSLQKGVRDKVMFLKAELEMMNALREDMSEVEEPNVQAKAWIKEVRELSYDIEDYIDDFILSVDARKPPGLQGFLERSVSLLPRAKARHRIATEIQGLKVRVLEMSARGVKCKVDEAVSERSEVALDHHLRILYDEPSHLVGIDMSRDRLIELLMAEEGEAQEKLKVVSIVGFGGLGKTTLAWEVYQKVGSQFDCKAFVSVSRKPDLRKILKNILSQVTKQEDDKIEELDEKNLIEKLREFLKDKRYFIVIDDLWCIETWRNVKCALLDNNRSSKIMTTTRHHDVAKSCCSPHYNGVCEMEPLSSSYSRKLFFGRIFGFEDRCPIQLKEVANEILNKCGGLPLVITAIASLLASKSSTKEQWERVKHSIGFGLEKNPDVEEMKRVMSLSYKDLPHYLKTCLLYLSIFPEDYEIESDHLVRRWVAEGFVELGSRQNLEEVAESYLEELIDRSMIQLVHGSQMDTCRVHDLILDLLKSKSIEENFVTLFGHQRHTSVLEGKVRRLSLDYRDGEQVMLPSTMILSHVRSLTVFGYAEHMPPLLDFRALRVLELECGGKLESRYLKSMGRLSQLKYLGIKGADIFELPKQLRKLQHLETLDLRGTNIYELPASVLQLQQLVHLLVDGYAKLPDGIGKMQGLRKLSTIRIYNSCSLQSVQELGKLTKLRHLGVRWDLADTDGDIGAYRNNLVLALQKLGEYSLHSLHVVYDGNDGHALDFLHDSWFRFPYLRRFDLGGLEYYFPKIPKWMALLPNLNYISINVFQVGENDLQILQELPSLLILHIWSVAAPEERLVIGSKGFQCLNKFSFRCGNCVGMGLIFEAGAMPRLEKFEVLFNARETESLDGAFDLGIHQLSHCLKRVSFMINCSRAKACEVVAAEAAVRNEINKHPYKPTLIIGRSGCFEDGGREEVDMQQKEEPQVESELD